MPQHVNPPNARHGPRRRPQLGPQAQTCLPRRQLSRRHCAQSRYERPHGLVPLVRTHCSETHHHAHISRGYVVQMEVVRARVLGYTVGDVPITFVDRIFGESNLDAGEIFQYTKGVCPLFITVWSIARTSYLLTKCSPKRHHVVPPRVKLTRT
jgi:dolichol-phosphate mannosyltransferase